MDVELIIPGEPTAIKAVLSALRAQEKDKQKINWSATYIWSGNQLPLYLWEKWRNDLNKKGFSWQSFLRIIKSRNYEAILWAHEKISWNEFVSELIDAIYGPLGQVLSGNEKILSSKHISGRVIQMNIGAIPSLMLDMPHQPSDASLAFYFDQVFNDFQDKNVMICIRELSE